MANKRGPARAAYLKKYNAQPKEKARRNALGRARYDYEKKHGKIPEGVDFDHVKPLRKGGSNSPSNMKPRSRHENRGWMKEKAKK